MLVLLILSINKAATDVAEMKQEEKSQQIKICLKLVKNILDVSPIFNSEIIAAKNRILKFLVWLKFLPYTYIFLIWIVRWFNLKAIFFTYYFNYCCNGQQFLLLQLIWNEKFRNTFFIKLPLWNNDPYFGC